MSKENVQLGQLLKGDEGRDAIHIAIAPVVAGEELRPGERVGFRHDKGQIVWGTNWVDHMGVTGIVDPFLTQNVQAGERFYLCLLPGTVRTLRHVWTHDDFPARPYQKLKGSPVDER